MSGKACRRHEVPITSITNGIHTKTWMAPEFAALFDKYLPDWEEHLDGAGFLARRHRYSRRGAVGDASKAEESAGRFCPRAGASTARAPRRIAGTHSPRQSDCSIRSVLTIGFARRFATYKRATLLFSDPERLRQSCSRTPNGRCNSSSPAKRIRRMSRASGSSSRSISFPGCRSSRTASSSSKTTTITSAAGFIRASISG